MKKFFSLLILGSALFLASCNSCSKKEANTAANAPTEFESKLTDADTTAVKKLVGTFFEHAMAERYHEAAGMLYHRQVGDGQAPEQLNNEQMQDVVNFLKTIPVEDYSIEYMKFQFQGNNEVKCKVIMQRGQNGAPDATTYFFFTPIYFMNHWCLILTDSPSGERPVSDEEDRDSLKALYKAAEAADKAEEKAADKAAASNSNS